MLLIIYIERLYIINNITLNRLGIQIINIVRFCLRHFPYSKTLILSNVCPSLNSMKSFITISVLYGIIITKFECALFISCFNSDLINRIGCITTINSKNFIKSLLSYFQEYHTSSKVSNLRVRPSAILLR